MNDFTKSDLQYLLWAVNYVRERTNNCGDSMRRLKGVIEDMVDNYSCHELHVNGCNEAAVKMNNFTKAELETIANWGDVYTEFGNSWSDKTERPLINKIQSIIDSYSDLLEEVKPETCKQPDN